MAEAQPPAAAEAQPPLAPGSGYSGTKYWRGVAVLYVTCIAHSYAVASVMSYVGFYAVDSGWAADVDAAGFVAGLLASAMPFGRIPASIAWGAAIDRFGTRDCLVASMCSLVVGHLVFALCRPLWAAMLARAVSSWRRARRARVAPRCRAPEFLKSQNRHGLHQLFLTSATLPHARRPSVLP